MENKTTIQQSKMLHALFRDIAKALNEEGITVQEFFEDSFEMIITIDSIRYLFPNMKKVPDGICEQLAIDLLDEGYTLNFFLKESNLIFSLDLIKDVFKQLAKKAYGVESTQRLNSKQIETLIDMFVHKLGGYGIEVEFPE